eukprot:10562508-Prorocentrum_lima.AAC.1
MTSSLVGSEMCIRDRLEPASRVKPRLQAVASSSALGERLFGFALVRLSVSYTHLTLPTICSV